MDPETRAYLDEPWEVIHGLEGMSIIFGSDGDPIVVCRVRNAAHLMTPEDVADYLMELHEERRRSRDEAIQQALSAEAR